MTLTQRSVCIATLLLGLTACANGDPTADEKQGGASAASKEETTEGDGDDGTQESDEGTGEEDEAAENQGDGDAPSDESSDAAIESPELPAACKLPFEPGSCFAAIPVFAYDAAKGACVKQIWGGCGGNGNRFDTLAMCEETCGGADEEPGECPPNSKRAEVCLACGLAGGCAEMAVTCALVCEKANDCKGGNEYPTTCIDGICQVFGCI